MSGGKRNRSAGNGWERFCVDLFKKAGFTDCVTSRLGNRSRDHQKIDLVNRDEMKSGRLPWSVQCKNVVGHVKYGKVLSEMPLEHGITRVILHNQTEKVNDRFITRGRFAIMYLDDFMELVGKLKQHESTATGKLV